MMIRKWEPAIVIGPDDQGLEMSLEEFEKAIGAEGFKYELIDGRVEVSPLPDLLHDTFEMRLMLLLWRFIDLHPEIANYASPKARIFVPGHRRATCPEPDVSLFPDVPWNQRPLRVNWRDVSPIVVAEVISPGNTSKDLVRNVQLYLEVPSIREYWIIDGRENADFPSLLVYRRRGTKWQKPIHVGPGETYTTKLLPDFELKLDAPHVES